MISIEPATFRFPGMESRLPSSAGRMRPGLRLPRNMYID